MTSNLDLLLVTHTAASVVALVLGIAVTLQLTRWRFGRAAMDIFLVTALFTSVSGFFFHTDRLLPSQIIGAVALVVLAATLPAYALLKKSAAAYMVFFIGVLLSTYLLAFVAIAQAFTKIAALKAVAPDLGSPFFIGAQTVLMVVALYVAYRGIRQRKATARRS
jgi:hypothetical protein